MDKSTANEEKRGIVEISKPLSHQQNPLKSDLQSIECKKDDDSALSKGHIETESLPQNELNSLKTKDFSLYTQSSSQQETCEVTRKDPCVISDIDLEADKFGKALGSKLEDAFGLEGETQVKNFEDSLPTDIDSQASTSKVRSTETLNQANDSGEAFGLRNRKNHNSVKIQPLTETKIITSNARTIIDSDVSENANATIPKENAELNLEDKIKDPNCEPKVSNTSSENKASDSSDNSSKEPTEFTCNICFETASSPVLTVCGHLYCWECLGQWLERNPTCPVCKAGCERDNVIPVYGRGKEAKDPRTSINLGSRPIGQRPAVPQRPNNNIFDWGSFGISGGFHSIGGNMYYPGSSSIGIFPGFFGVSYVNYLNVFTS
ncbi:E3 ubiquitin-protein ligase RNF5 [Smittium culicis]|uniref:RING-type E3 ubiquitin transferase n=1 Tax=Smittium culicis TaxID=133412 RepID=A0A1R1XW97_9FUNG|nr:E3 ubiquitin-protein ligase RNF5 [Smittium culicis]